MAIEDYNKYYIQGSDHYLIPKDELKFLLRENQELKSQLKGTTHCFDEKEHKRLSEQLELLTSKLDEYDLIVDERNQLKKQLEVGEEQYNDLVEEKEKLQEQLSSNTLQLEKLKKQVNKGLYNVCLPYKTGYDKAIKDKEIQQKEFIKYMNDTIEDLETENVDDEEMKGYLIQRIHTFKEILQKYKSIIGDDK